MIGICALVGSFVGSYVPVVLWHASSLGAESLLFGGVGAIAGVLLGARIGES